MQRYVIGLQEIQGSTASQVGGKGANLGELHRLDGIAVPGGFCVTTLAFERVVRAVPSFDHRLDQLERAPARDRALLSAELRDAVLATPLPDEVQTPILRALSELGEDGAYAVRSSATAEDLPGASFAGQHESYLNVVGAQAILEHIRRCWASLYTDRAIAYRTKHGFDQAKVRMAVVVQRMVPARASGVLFTADPVSGHRRVTVLEAIPGLGEALLSGHSEAKRFRIRDGKIVEKSADVGGEAPLTEAQALELETMGRQIEKHFGAPQDIEWCLTGEEFQVVQSRPITTLFPIPEGGEPGPRVYLSVGHQQMMTDPLKPLGLSVFQLTAARPMYAAAGRLFVDPTDILLSPGREALLTMMGQSDPLMREGLMAVLERQDFLPPHTSSPAELPSVLTTPPAQDPAIIEELTARSQAALAALERDVERLSGTELFDAMRNDLGRRAKAVVEPLGISAIADGQRIRVNATLGYVEPLATAQ